MDVSLVASANRIKWWPRFLDSLKKHQIKYEVIFVGNVKPDFDTSKYPEFKHIYATCKPCQCYQIGFWAAQGKVIHWTADDASYSGNATLCDNSLDIAFKKWEELEAQYGNDGKSMIALNPCEDGGYPQREFHRFWGGWKETPVMAPFALIPRKYLADEGQGYDRNFVSGQAENDICMRVYEDGGRLECCYDAKLYVHHRQCHARDNITGKEKNDFRKWYPEDRRALEEAWVKGGYGYYEKINRSLSTPESRKDIVANLSSKRLKPVDCFIKTNDIYTVSQGVTGQW